MCWLKKPTTSPAIAIPIVLALTAKPIAAGRHVVVPGQRRQDRLRRKQVDHGQKGGQADDQGSQHHARRVAVHFHHFGFHARQTCRS